MGRHQILIATNNRGKRDEIGLLLGAQFEVLRLSDLGTDILEFVEEEKTFRENSEAKALYYHHQTNLPTIADDSGLCVDYLDGAPGVLSSRWAGEEADDEQRIKKLLGLLSGVAEQDRAAHFVCSVSFVDRGKTERNTEGRVNGIITETLHGESGFGYDPVFFHSGSGLTFAQMTMGEKNKISHRGIAMRAMAEFLKSYFK